MDLHDCDERGVEIVGFRFFGVEDFDGESTTGDGEDRTFEEIFRELFGIESGRGDDEFKIWPPF